MILINLFPHREAARQRRRHRFALALGLSVMAGLLLAGGVSLWQAAAIAAQRARNEVLRTEISRLDTQIRDITDLQRQIAALRARQQAVEGLQADRNLPVHLLQALASQLPEGLYLSGLRQEGQGVVLQGVAQSNERVSQLLRNLGHRSAWLTQPELVETVGATLQLGPRESRRVTHFQVRVRLLRASEAAAPAGT